VTRRSWAFITGGGEDRSARPGFPVRSALRSIGPQVIHDDGALANQTLRNDRSMARFRVGLDTEQRAGTFQRQLRHDLDNVDTVEDLPLVPLAVPRRERDSRTLSDTAAGVICILELSELGGRRELAVVPVADLRIGERVLQPHRVGPSVLAAPHAAALPHVEQHADVGGDQSLQERVEIPLVDPDRADALHRAQTATTAVPPFTLSLHVPSPKPIRAVSQWIEDWQ